MPKDYANLVGYSHNFVEKKFGDWPAEPSTNNDWHSEQLPSATKQRKRSKEIELEDNAIEAEISAACYILKIEAEDGDADFSQYEFATLQRATKFLRGLVLHAHSCGFTGIGVPEILPSANGSIDVLWRSASKRLLINFPSVVTERATYYGRKGSSEFAGKFPSDEARPELIYWLTS